MITLSISTPKARKAHRCAWCGEDIEQGETYRRFVGIYDGEFQSSALHLECDEAAAEALGPWDYEYEPFANPRGGAPE